MEEEIKNIKPGKKNDRFLGVSIIIAAVMIGGSILYTSHLAPSAVLTNTNPKTAPLQEAKIDMVQVQADGPILGDPHAPVAVVEFGDYQCPFCGRFFNDAEKGIVKNYVQTGKVKFVFRNFPLREIHPYAQPAAEAAECANAQGKFWEYHNRLFELQDQLGTLDYVDLAKTLGLNTDQFSSCLKNKTYDAEIEKDYQDGQALNISGTPTTFIGGQVYVGAQPYSVFDAAIQAELKK